MSSIQPNTNTMTQNHMSIKPWLKTSILLFFSLTISFNANSQSSIFYGEKGVAIKGYDPVAYFTEQKAVEGINAYSTEWSGVIWQFKNEDNLQTFKNDPAKYAPQFGGWCAYGVSDNHKSPTDPFAWTIIDSKLYLNYSPKVKEKWIVNTEKLIDQANKYWVELKDK